MKEKASFYLSVDTTNTLEGLWLEWRMISKDKTLNKSRLVEHAIDIMARDIQMRGVKSKYLRPFISEK